MLVALWDVSEQTFGSSSGGALSWIASIWLFNTFGHWGPRLALITIGILFMALSFRLASLARDDEAPSETRLFAVLSWTLVLLVLSLLAFIALGPLFRNPAIDSVLSHWREKYYAPATGLTITSLLGLCSRLNWMEFRETGEPSKVLVMLMFLVLTIILFIVLLLSSWEAIFGS